MSIYVELTHEFNTDKRRAILSGGQAVVLYRLAIMSKDGDWILLEEQDVLDHVLSVLDGHGARYRFGSPLDVRWMSGGWSSHLEFRTELLRIRTDFVTRPPRLEAADIERLWETPDTEGVAVVSVRQLIELKKTNREKDYAVIGELARLLADPANEILLSRSARDILRLVDEHPALLQKMISRRPALAAADGGEGELEKALDAERRSLIHANEERLQGYMEAAEEWRKLWPEVASQIKTLSLKEAHAVVVDRAQGVLPCSLKESIP